MPKVFLSVGQDADGGEAARYLNARTIPFETLPFPERSFVSWLTELERRAGAGDIAVVILRATSLIARGGAHAQEIALSEKTSTRRVVMVGGSWMQPFDPSRLLLKVANAVERFSTPEELRTRLDQHVGHLARTPLPPAPSFMEAGVYPSGVTDEASAVDHLGFAPYVDAVAAFLTHPNTPAPLTMSIEGPWGSGKSSFMRQLEGRLEGHFRTVRFNAWRHEKAEELWAAFALHFLERIRPRGRWQRWRAEARLAWHQFNLASGWADLLRVMLWFIALAAATVTLLGMGVVLGPRSVSWFASQHAQSPLGQMLESWLGPALGAGGWFAGAAGLLTLWRKFLANVKSPLEIDLRKYLRRPDYESRLTFLERFQRDLGDATEVYLADGKKVFVFIDDLDRCELPQAAELMRAINLMLSDSGPIVFVIGMDREKVAAALAVKHEKLLPYLVNEAPRKPDDDAVSDTLQGLFFGYGFIEKFIQVPFAVPEPTETNIEELLMSMRPSPAGKHSRTSTPALRPTSSFQPGETSQPEVTRVRLHEFIRPLEEETVHFARLVTLVMPALGNNPRRIKQFINIFRLRVLIAFATGLFDAPEDTPIEKRITIEKLAKFTAIELRWPLLLTHLEIEPQLIGSLEKVALEREEPDTFRVEYWAAKLELMMLLRAGFDATGEPLEGEKGQWLLGTIDVTQLTRVSVKQPQSQPQPQPKIEVASEAEVPPHDVSRAEPLAAEPEDDRPEMIFDPYAGSDWGPL